VKFVEEERKVGEWGVKKSVETPPLGREPSLHVWRINQQPIYASWKCRNNSTTEGYFRIRKNQVSKDVF
jgi:hypothetical protein